MGLEIALPQAIGAVREILASPTTLSRFVVPGPFTSRVSETALGKICSTFKPGVGPVKSLYTA